MVSSLYYCLIFSYSTLVECVRKAGASSKSYWVDMWMLDKCKTKVGLGLVTADFKQQEGKIWKVIQLSMDISLWFTKWVDVA